VEKGVDSRKGSCVGPYLVIYLYSVSSYRPSHLSLCTSSHFSFTTRFRYVGVFAGRMTGRRHLRVIRSFISSCSSASVHSLPCGPRMAEEKESGYPAPSRFKSAWAGECTGGAVMGAEA
jgi:hypothetical protein